MLIETASGPVLLTGCAHAGIVNTIRYASKLSGRTRFAAVLGGMHLCNATPERIARTVSELSSFEIAALGPVHCSGEGATAALQESFGSGLCAFHAGTALSF